MERCNFCSTLGTNQEAVSPYSCTSLDILQESCLSFAYTNHITMCRNKDFYGNDVIALHAMARNGVEDAQFPIFVEPINDHPVILAPRSIFLGGKESRKGHQIYDKSRDTFQFSIVEPDLHNFPGTLYVYFVDVE